MLWGLVGFADLEYQIRYFTTVVADLCWVTSILSHVSNYDGLVLEICLSHKFQWPQEGLNCESFV